MARYVMRGVFVVSIIVGLVLTVHFGSRFGTAKANEAFSSSAPTATLPDLPSSVERLPAITVTPGQTTVSSDCTRFIDASSVALFSQVVRVYAGFPNAMTTQQNVAALQGFRDRNVIGPSLFKATSEAWLATTDKRTFVRSVDVTSCLGANRTNLSQKLFMTVTITTSAVAMPSFSATYEVDVARIATGYIVLAIVPKVDSEEGDVTYAQTPTSSSTR